MKDTILLSRHEKLTTRFCEEDHKKKTKLYIYPIPVAKIPYVVIVTTNNMTTKAELIVHRFIIIVA